MARRFRPGPLALGLGLWNVWQRLTPAQRKQLMKLIRTHGPKAAARLVELRRRRRP